MKPRNKFQEQVAANIHALRPLTQAQRQWGYDHSLYKYAYRRPNGKTICMECGHTFETKAGKKQCVCPHCRKLLKVEDTAKRTLHREGYFCVASTRKGMQVLRYFKIHSYSKIGQPTRNNYYQVMQRWINEKGKTAITALPRAMFSYYTDSWNYNADIELRKYCSALEYVDGCPTYPHISTIPAVRRNGFKGSLHHIAPASLFESLLTNPKVETLFKAGQYALAKHFAYSRRDKADNYWAAVKIAIRNNYVVSDASIWCDYIDTLSYMGKDIHNAKFVCPKDLKAEHDRWMEKREKKLEEKRIREQIEKARENEEKFRELKSKFFGIRFTDGLICVHVLESVEEYLQEGEHMHHCVFSNKYYLKKDSLILSATIDGKRVETIEVSLKTMKILQCYGACNKFTEHHAHIIDLVNKNAHLIGQRLKAA